MIVLDLAETVLDLLTSKRPFRKAAPVDRETARSRIVANVLTVAAQMWNDPDYAEIDDHSGIKEAMDAYFAAVGAPVKATADPRGRAPLDRAYRQVVGAALYVAEAAWNYRITDLQTAGDVRHLSFAHASLDEYLDQYGALAGTS